jgi:hypothetical protein
MARYIQNRLNAQAEGTATEDRTGDVVPFESASVQLTDPKTAWQAAIGVAGLLRPGAALDKNFQPLSAWSVLVAESQPCPAVACAFGNYPQLLRDLSLILEAENLSSLRPATDGNDSVGEGLAEWAAKMARLPEPHGIAAAGVLRLAGQFNQAGALLKNLEDRIAPEWQPALLNERGALAWHRGRWDEAKRLWGEAEPTMPVLFNRGMSSLFSDEPGKARAHLSKVVSGIADANPWHHLGALYLALAGIRS